MRPTRPAGAHRLHIAEPKSAYTSRPALVVDASIVAAALFAEENRAEAEALLHARALHAPHLLDYEIAGVGIKKIRHGSLPEAAVAPPVGGDNPVPVERLTIQE